MFLNDGGGKEHIKAKHVEQSQQFQGRRKDSQTDQKNGKYQVCWLGGEQ